MGDDMRKPRACECYGRIPLGHDMFLLRPEISTFAEKYRQRHAAIDFPRSEEHTSELQSRFDLVCRLLLEKKKKRTTKERNRNWHKRVGHAVISTGSLS